MSNKTKKTKKTDVTNEVKINKINALLRDMKKDDLVELLINNLAEKNETVDGEKKTAYNSKTRLEEVLNYHSYSSNIRNDFKEKLNITVPSVIVGENLDERTSDPALREMEELKVIHSHTIKKVFDAQYATEILTLVLNDGTRLSLKPELVENTDYKFIKLIVENIKTFA